MTDAGVHLTQNQKEKVFGFVRSLMVFNDTCP
jgi:hypothetical protein